MKYIVFWEFSPDDWEKIVPKFQEYMKDHEENPGKYQEYLLGGHAFAGQTKGFSVVEATPEQISNVFLFWRSLLHLKYVPIEEITNIVGQYLETK